VPGLVEHYAETLGTAPIDIRLMLPLTLANWFYLQWCDGRAAFSTRMYRIINHYFENVESWETVFVPYRSKRGL
jgi:hypothetical protein